MPFSTFHASEAENTNLPLVMSTWPPPKFAAYRPRFTEPMISAGSWLPASIKRGLYATNFGGGQVDITSGKFVFSASEAFWVENGKILYPVKGATLIGNGPEAMTRVSMIGNDMALDTGVGTCGKDGQSVPVGVGQPTLRIEKMTVGGTR